MDTLTPEQRRAVMAKVRSANTKPELLVRRGLHRRGFRFRLHGGKLPGRPDLVLKRHGAVVFVHGCFWHGHACPLCRLPSTRADYWRAKIENNRRRDQANLDRLFAEGWRVAVVWECALRGRQAPGVERSLDRLADWLRSDFPYLDVAGTALKADS